jgi:hypothetical protein
MVGLKARIVLPINALSPILDMERLDSFTQMYEAQAENVRSLLAEPISYPA